MDLVILDLNGVLCCTAHKRLYPGGELYRRKYLWRRPDTAAFLEWLFAHRRVAVWTSCEYQNANALVDLLFTPEQRAKLLFFWTRAECKLGPNFASYKPLARVWAAFPQYNSSNTRIVDDSPEKMIAPPECIVTVQTFSPHTTTTLLSLFSADCPESH